MIPQAYIQAWREHAPCPNSAQVKQDLVICRDLFDLHHGLTQLGLDLDKVVIRLNHYLALEDHPISRAEAEERMLKKLTRSLTEDIEPLLPVGVRFDETVVNDAFNNVWSTLIARIRGDAWRLTADVVAQLRTKYPRLLT